jgi:hypothetical protein
MSGLHREEALCEQASVLDLAQVLGLDMESRLVLRSLGAGTLYGFTRDEAGSREHSSRPEKTPGDNAYASSHS